MKKDKKKILVIGDLILDAYHHGRYLGKSVADGVTTVGHGHTSRFTWGGAGLLVRNILALGGSVSFVSLIGQDDFAPRANEFSHPRLKKIFLQVPSRPTTVKQRFWIRNRNSFEWHRFDNSPLSPALRDQVLRAFRSELASARKVIIADYRHGLFSPALAKQIIRECSRAKIPLYVDSQIAYNTGNLQWYKGAYLFCLNQKEAESAERTFTMRQLLLSLERLQKTLRAPNIVVKLGARGSAALLGDRYIRTRAHAVRAVDPTGAGDAYLGCLAVGNAPPTTYDLERANVWAGLSTTMIGTEIPSTTEFRKIISLLKNLD
jgi:D-beta-D-heptose 7-phosphate kinase/D-beta-D-heptose 1-phosphate adenosyltransferase